MRFVEGPIHPISCIAPGAEKSCSFAASCVFRDIWLQVEQVVSGVIDNIAFSDLGFVAIDRKGVRGFRFYLAAGMGCRPRLAKILLIPLPLGDMTATDAKRLVSFLDCFGENVLRLTMTQNLQVRNLPARYYGNLYELVSTMETLSHLPRVTGEIIACTGANTCTTGVCLPQVMVPVIHKYLLPSGLDFTLLRDLRINISGCPNSCGQHHVGYLGFFGRIARKNGKTIPAYCYCLASISSMSLKNSVHSR